ncbi:MAG: signal peptide peptidase SppA [Limisphaerales bacterium]
MSPGLLPPPVLPPPPPPSPAPATRPTPPPRRGGGIWIVLAVLLILGAVAVLVLPMVWVADRLPGFGSGGQAGWRAATPRRLIEVTVEPSASRDKIAIIDLDGIISSAPFDRRGMSLVDYVKESLRMAADDRHVKAVIVRIDSPGGEVLASDDIYRLLAEFQEGDGADKPVIASMGSLAASGGYYVAAPARWIVANELTLTGSIGVIMQTFNFRGLMDKVGVRSLVFKSGELKDMLSAYKSEDQITEEEKAIIQNIVNESFTRFKAVVEEGRGLAHAHNRQQKGESDRGRALAKDWEEYADGRVLTGREAHKLGFVDELGGFDTAVERARKFAGLEEATLVRYALPMGFGTLFPLLGRSSGDEAKLSLDLGFDVPRLEAGKLYLLSPTYIR